MIEDWKPEKVRENYPPFNFKAAVTDLELDTDVVYELPTNYGMVLDSESHATEYSGTDVTNFPLSDDAQPRRQIILERPLGLIEGRGSIVEMNRRAFYEAFGYSIDGQDQTNASSRAASVITQTPVQVYDDWEDATNDGL